MTLPLIVPGIVAAGMLSFAVLDDFIITYFVSGSTVTYPFGQRGGQGRRTMPQIDVLATAILLVSLILLAVGTRTAASATSEPIREIRRSAHRAERLVVGGRR